MALQPPSVFRQLRHMFSNCPSSILCCPLSRVHTVGNQKNTAVQRQRPAANLKRLCCKVSGRSRPRHYIISECWRRLQDQNLQQRCGSSLARLAPQRQRADLLGRGSWAFECWDMHSVDTVDKDWECICPSQVVRTHIPGWGDGR